MWIRSKWEAFNKTKAGVFMKRHHLYELILIAVFYGFMSLIYFLTSNLSGNYHTIDMAIDQKIPFIKYFVVFYYTYYFMPPILLWRVSYKDQKKFRRMILTCFLVDIIANIIFLCYNVQMIRSDTIDLAMKLSDINSFDKVFDYLVSVIYRADSKAVCCFPSLHAALGTLMVLLSLSPNKETRLHPVLSVFGILSGVGCMFSAVFIKQHYFIDVIAGILLSLIVYGLVLLILRIIDRNDRNRKDVADQHLSNQ